MGESVKENVSRVRHGDPTEKTASEILPACDAVLHAKRKNKGITSMIVTHSLSVSTQDPGCPKKLASDK